MRLAELNPRFLKVVTDKEFHRIDTVAEADGILFLCPVCFQKNGGSVGTHSVICWSPKIGQNVPPTPGRWNLVGSGYDDLTLVAGSSSVALTGDGCKAHFFIRNGEIILC